MPRLLADASSIELKVTTHIVFAGDFSTAVSEDVISALESRSAISSSAKMSGTEVSSSDPRSATSSSVMVLDEDGVSALESRRALLHVAARVSVNKVSSPESRPANSAVLFIVTEGVDVDCCWVEREEQERMRAKGLYRQPKPGHGLTSVKICGRVSFESYSKSVLMMDRSSV